MTFNTTCINLYSEMNDNMEFVIIPHNNLIYKNVNKIASKAYEDWMEATCPAEKPIGDYIIEQLKEKGGYKLGKDYKMYYDAQWD